MPFCTAMLLICHFVMCPRCREPWRKLRDLTCQLPEMTVTRMTSQRRSTEEVPKCYGPSCIWQFWKRMALLGLNSFSCVQSFPGKTMLWTPAIYWDVLKILQEFSVFCMLCAWWQKGKELIVEQQTCLLYPGRFGVCVWIHAHTITHTRTHTRTQLSNPSGLLWFYCLLQCVHCFKRSIAPARTKQQKPENRHTILMGRQLPCAANQITTRSNTWCRNLAPDIQLSIALLWALRIIDAHLFHHNYQLGLLLLHSCDIVGFWGIMAILCASSSFPFQNFCALSALEPC